MWHCNIRKTWNVYRTTMVIAEMKLKMCNIPVCKKINKIIIIILFFQYSTTIYHKPVNLGAVQFIIVFVYCVHIFAYTIINKLFQPFLLLAGIPHHDL